MNKWGRPHGAEEPAEEEASQASGHTPQPYLSMPATLPELKEREGGAFQESSPPQGYGGEPVHLSLCESSLFGRIHRFDCWVVGDVQQTLTHTDEEVVLHNRAAHGQR